MVGKAYGDEEENDPSEWVRIDLEAFIGRAPDDDCPPRVHLFAKRFKSSSPDWEDFLHDPLRFMLMKPGDIARTVQEWPAFPGDDADDPRAIVEGGALQAIRDDPRWAVHTNVTNHHRKLSRVHALALTSMDDPPGAGSITVTIYKDATLIPPHLD